MVRMDRINRNMIETHDHIRDHVPIRTVDAVLKNLKDYGFSVIEYKKIHGKQDEYACILDGKLADLHPEKQAYLKNVFKVKFEGTADVPHTQIEFSVRKSQSTDSLDRKEEIE